MSDLELAAKIEECASRAAEGKWAPELSDLLHAGIPRIVRSLKGSERFLREVECGCGDIRFAGDMCHICGKCQLGCCMCEAKNAKN